MRYRLTFMLAAGFALVLIQPLAAEVALPPVISDNMVMQGEIPVPVWGTAADGETVTVEVASQKKTVNPEGGKWKVVLDPLKFGEKLEMKISAKNSITIRNILVGEVWHASGQSNMKYPLAKATDGPEVIARTDIPEFRYFIAPRGPWVAATPKTAGTFSAAAYYFAVDLHEKLKRPVGIIDTAVSGACGQQFISPEALNDDVPLAEALKAHDIAQSDIYNSSVVTVIPYAIRGAFWYQGEGNRDFPVTYRRLLAALIADWRKQWGSDFPFIIVQLANYQQRRDDPWEGKDCAVRESQLKVSQAVKNTALVVTIDLGIAADVHYPNKKLVGDRGAVAARALVYGEKIESSGPIFESAKFADGKAVVSFTHVGGGLVAQGDTLKGFLLCGADKKFMRAEARIEGNQIVVTSPAVAAPIAVRYAWERNPDCNLYNREGLPASPFRSDEFVNFFTSDGK